MVNVVVKATCLTSFFLHRRQCGCYSQNGDYDGEDHGVFASIANTGTHATQLVNTVREYFKCYSGFPLFHCDQI